jgi:prepilin-type N-terminal cleavage/methylation domain-containing protein
MTRIQSTPPICRPNQPASPGFTLVELLLGVLLGGITLAAAAQIVVSHLNSTNTTIWSSQIQRDLSKFNFLLSSEAEEGCRLQSGAAPANGTACAPPPAISPCNGVAAPLGNLNILVPMAVANNDPVGRVITYKLVGNQVLRDGPRILTTGRLDSTVANNQNNAVVLDGVTAFTPTVATDCRTATLLVTLTVPTTANTVSQTITLATGVTDYLQ